MAACRLMAIVNAKHIMCLVNWKLSTYGHTCGDFEPCSKTSTNSCPRLVIEEGRSEQWCSICDNDQVMSDLKKHFYVLEDSEWKFSMPPNMMPEEERYILEITEDKRYKRTIALDQSADVHNECIVKDLEKLRNDNTMWDKDANLKPSMNTKARERLYVELGRGLEEDAVPELDPDSH